MSTFGYLGYYVAQQEGCVLVARHARCYLVSVGYALCQPYLEAPVAEALGPFVGHARQFEVMGGYHPAHGQCRDGIEEHSRAVQLVERIGAFQYLVEYYQRVVGLLAAAYELPQSQQLGVEVAYAVAQVVARAHAAEEVEHRYAQLPGKYRHAVHGKDVVHPDGAQERALARHVGSGYDVVVVVGNGKVVAHCPLAQERVPQPLGLKPYAALGAYLRVACGRLVVAECGHRYERVHLAHAVNPPLHAAYVVAAPCEEAAHKEEVAQQQRVEEHQTQHVAPAVETVDDAFQLAERLAGGPVFGGAVALAALRPAYLSQVGGADEAYQLGVSPELPLQVSGGLCGHAQRLGADKVDRRELRHAPCHGQSGLHVRQRGQQYGGREARDGHCRHGHRYRRAGKRGYLKLGSAAQCSLYGLGVNVSVARGRHEFRPQRFHGRQPA